MKTCFILLSTMLISSALYAQAGWLDSSFNQTGIATMDVSGLWDVGGLRIQADGKILVAGTVGDDSPGGNIGLMRLNDDGSPDASFGIDGRVVTVISNHDYAKTLAIQPDGKIVVGGSINHHMAVLRYNSDGSPDSSFGIAGIFTMVVSVNNQDDEILAIAVLPDGKILAAGWAVTNISLSAPAELLLRLEANGIPDVTFGIDGIQINEIFANGTFVFGLAIDDMDRIITCGVDQELDQAMVVLCHHSDGLPDPAFGTGGVSVVNITPELDVARNVVMQADGRILVSGAANAGISGGKIAAIRLLENGMLDSSFSENGIMWSAPGLSAAANYSFIAAQPDGKIIWGGTDHTGFYNDVALLRLNNSGTMDSSFGNNGLVITSAGPEWDSGKQVALQEDGKIVVAGLTYNDNDSQYDLVVIRYLNDLNIGISEVNTPADFNLQYYPNPFTGSARVSYTLNHDDQVSLKLFDMMGKLLFTLVEEQKSKGRQTEELHLENLPAGSYILNMTTESETVAVKIIRQ